MHLGSGPPSNEKSKLFAQYSSKSAGSNIFVRPGGSLTSGGSGGSLPSASAAMSPYDYEVRDISEHILSNMNYII